MFTQQTNQFDYLEALDDLKMLGKVRIHHYRIVDGFDPNLTEELPMSTIRRSGMQRWIRPRGGKTVVLVELDDYTMVESVALCNPLDKYVRKDGIALALMRAYNFLYGHIQQRKMEMDVVNAVQAAQEIVTE